MQELTKFAAGTPFSLESITKADTILQGFGIRSEKLLTTVGDAAANTGVDFGELAVMVGKLSVSKDMDKLLPLIERGVLGFDELRAAGVEFSKDGKSVVSSVDATFGAITGALEKKFGGSMEALATTLSGKISTLLDNVKLTLGNFAQQTGLFDGVKMLLDTMIAATAWINTNIVPKFGAAFTAIKETVMPVIESLSLTMQQTWVAIQIEALPVITQMGIVLQQVFDLVSQIAAEGFQLLTSALEAFGISFDSNLMENFDLFRDVISPTITAFVETFLWGLDTIEFGMANWSDIVNRELITLQLGFVTIANTTAY